MLKDQLIDFMKSFEKDHDDFRLYVTFDHVLLHVKDFTAVCSNTWCALAGMG